MEQVGYSLVDANGNETKFWGETIGQAYKIPDVIQLSNGDFVHCAEVGTLTDGSRLVTRWVVDNRPSRWFSITGTDVSFDGEKIVVTILYADVPDIVPTSITKLQVRNAAVQLGNWQAIKTAIASDPDTQEMWDLTVQVDRSHPLVEKMAAAISASDADIDKLFRLAATPS